MATNNLRGEWVRFIGGARSHYIVRLANNGLTLGGSFTTLGHASARAACGRVFRVEDADLDSQKCLPYRCCQVCERVAARVGTVMKTFR